MALLTRTRRLGLDQSFLESDEIDKILINVRLVRNGPVVPLFVHEYKNLAYLETLIICELPIFPIAKARYSYFVNKIGRYLVQDFFVGGETVVYQVSCIACLQ